MEGVSVINTIPIYAAANAWMVTAALHCLLVALVIAVAAYIFTKLACDTTSTVLVITSMVLVITCFVFVAIYSLSDNINTDVIEKYQYEVLIEDSVRFNDFNDKYEVVDNRGEIYVIEEKN